MQFKLEWLVKRIFSISHYLECRLTEKLAATIE